MRSKLIAGNWKMNTSWEEAKSLFNSVNEFPSNNKSMAVCVPACYLAGLCPTHPQLSVFAQDCSAHEKGAFTGEISATMLASLGVKGSLVGHSERRQYHNETSELLKRKVDQLLTNNLTAIYCIGETLEERNNELHFATVTKQIEEVIGHLSSTQMKNIVIAYEPVWAIGTGVTASNEQAQEMHAHIRSFLKTTFGEVANDIQILYGGSMNAANAQALLACEDVDGGLIGGASLKVADFEFIYNA